MSSAVVTPAELRERTTAFAAATRALCRTLRTHPDAADLAGQLGRSSSGVAANYRVATRARSRREFISRLAVAVEEADETLGWLDLIGRSGFASGPEFDALLREAEEILAILAASRRTAERNATPRRQP